MTTEEQFAEIRTMLKTLATTAMQHDDQIEALITVAEKNSAQIAATAAQVQETSKAVANMEKQWQAYIDTLPRQ